MTVIADSAIAEPGGDDHKRRLQILLLASVANLLAGTLAMSVHLGFAMPSELGLGPAAGAVVRFGDTVVLGRLGTVGSELTELGLGPSVVTSNETSVSAQHHPVGSSSATPPGPLPTGTESGSDPSATGPGPLHAVGADSARSRNWRLEVVLTADRSVAAPGDVIRYVITVTNVGDRTFPVGRMFEVAWHIPLGTRNAQRLECTSAADRGLLPVEEERCSTAILAHPGLGEGSTRETTSGGLVRLRPGEQWSHEFAVEVLEVTPHGTEILDHAHLDVVGDGDGEMTSQDVVVLVDSLAPQATL